MEEYKAKLEEYKSLMGNTDPDSEKRKAELIGWLKANHSDKMQAVADEWAEAVVGELETGVEELKQESLRMQMNEKLYKLTPWSYIAEHYFGKSVSWLTQRVNGYPVRGHVYTLNEEQKQTLNRALSEIGEFIGSYRFT